MKTFILLDNKNETILPEEFLQDDVRFTESLVKYFLELYTKPEDTIIDIFAGFGTTIRVAEELKRKAFGIEFNKVRYEYTKSIVKNKHNIIHGSALDLLSFSLPKFDFSITSPPYMMSNDDENPQTNYSTKGNYLKYLDGLQKIYSQLKNIMNPDAYVVIEVSNLKRDNKITTLAWDIAKVVSTSFKFEGEIIVGWKGELKDGNTYGYGYDHSYCLIFKNE